MCDSQESSSGNVSHTHTHTFFFGILASLIAHACIRTLSNTRSLHLVACEAGNEGATELALLLCTPTCALKELHLDDNAIGGGNDNDDDASDGVAAIATALRQNKSLRV